MMSGNLAEQRETSIFHSFLYAAGGQLPFRSSTRNVVGDSAVISLTAVPGVLRVVQQIQVLVGGTGTQVHGDDPQRGDVARFLRQASMNTRWMVSRRSPER